MPFIVEGQVSCSHNNDDWSLVRDKTRVNAQFKERNVRYGFGSNNKTINPFYHILSGSMFIYQKCISPVLWRSCAYVPSCSGYSKALIKRYGLLKGTICSADRLMRCNRISLADTKTMMLIDTRDGHIHESVERYN